MLKFKCKSNFSDDFTFNGWADWAALCWLNFFFEKFSFSIFICFSLCSSRWSSSLFISISHGRRSKMTVSVRSVDLNLIVSKIDLALNNFAVVFFLKFFFLSYLNDVNCRFHLPFRCCVVVWFCFIFHCIRSIRRSIQIKWKGNQHSRCNIKPNCNILYYVMALCAWKKYWINDQMCVSFFLRKN